MLNEYCGKRYIRQRKEAVHIDAYLTAYEENKIVLCKTMIQAVDRVKRYLGQYEYRHTEVIKRIKFIESACALPTGERELFKLAVPQRFWLSVVYGFFQDIEVEKVDNETGETYTDIDTQRLVREVPLVVGRANGKTALMSALVYTHILLEGANEGAICLARVREQAALLYNASREMANREGTLLYNLKQLGVLKSTKQGLLNTNNGSLFSIKTSDARVLDGLGSGTSLAFFDECHAYEENFIQVVRDGLFRKNKNPMIWIITTQGHIREAVLDQYLGKWRKVLSGEIEDDSIMPFIYEIDDIEEVRDESKWQKSNPLLGITVRKEDIRKDLEASTGNIVLQKELLTKTFNFPTTAHSIYFSNEECRGNRDAFKPELFVGSDYRHAKVVCGIDLSETGDTCCVSFMARKGQNNYFYNLKFLPQKTVDELPASQKERYLQWQSNGDFHFITKPYNCQDEIFEIVQKFVKDNNMQIIKAGYDRWNARRFTQLIEDYHGDILYPVPMTVKQLSPALKIFKSKLQHGEIIFNDPVATWHMGNVAVKADGAGNVYPNKAKATGKIDVAMAMLIALSTYMDNAEELSSYYRHEDLTES